LTYGICSFPFRSRTPAILSTAGDLLAVRNGATPNSRLSRGRRNSSLSFYTLMLRTLFSASALRVGLTKYEKRFASPPSPFRSPLLALRHVPLPTQRVGLTVFPTGLLIQGGFPFFPLQTVPIRREFLFFLRTRALFFFRFTLGKDQFLLQRGGLEVGPPRIDTLLVRVNAAMSSPRPILDVDKQPFFRRPEPPLAQSRISFFRDPLPLF